jgi:nucleotide-binding universal stress UspA family protein
MTLKTFESHQVGDITGDSPLQVKRILVPVDFSPASQKAFADALSLATHFGSELIVLYVVPPAPASAFTSVDGLPPFSEADLSAGERNLVAFTKSARTRGIAKASASVRIGVPSHEIVEAAKDSDADLIVIATHGYTGWKHFCIGSTAERVVRAAPCPVLVVREKEHEFC